MLYNFLKTSKNSRLAWLDGARGIAILLVILVHISQIPNNLELFSYVLRFGQYGVQLFFIISVLTCIISFKEGTIRSDWYIKRITRISVLYFFGIIFYYFNYLALNRMGYDRYIGYSDFSNVIANLLYINALVPSANNSVVPGGWSISIEVLFYLVFPFLVLLINMKKYAISFILFISIMMMLFNYLLNGHIRNNSFYYFWPLNQFPVFFIALAMYYTYIKKIFFSDIVNYIFLILGLFLLILGGLVGVWLDISHILAPSFVGSGFVFILLGLGWMKKYLENRFLVFLGRISFSLYIIHFFCIDVVKFSIKHLNISYLLNGFFFSIFLITTVFLLSVILAIILKLTLEDKYYIISNKIISIKNKLKYDVC